jgi:hypothetical protein
MPKRAMLPTVQPQNKRKMIEASVPPFELRKVLLLTASEKNVVFRPARDVDVYVSTKAAEEMFNPEAKTYPGSKEETLASIREAFVQQNLVDFTFCIADCDGSLQPTKHSSIKMPEHKFFNSMYPTSKKLGIIIRANEQVSVNLLNYIYGIY